MSRVLVISKTEYWKRIGIISFLLAVFVIVRHNSSFANYDTPVGTSFHLFLQDTVTALAIPMFFLISGLNFFRDYTLEKQIEKLKNRIKSLLVPYIVWNTIYCVFVLITSNTTISRFFIGRKKYELTFPNIVLGCIYHWNCNSHFWFVFDLMLFALLNPVFYYLLKNKIIGLIIIVIGYFSIFIIKLKFPLEFVYRTDAFFYYLLGAYFAMHHVIFTDYTSKDVITSKNAKNITSISIGMFLIALSFLMGVSGFPYLLQPCIILLGCYGLWLVSSAFSNIDSSRIPSGGSIFIFYAAHGIIQPVIVKLAWLVLPKNPWISAVNFGLTVILTIFCCMIMRMVMRRYFPILDHVLCGWRK